jgi:hypothetical protein
MNVYRLDPIDPGHASWAFSKEKNSVWVGSATGDKARDLAAARSGFDHLVTSDATSPWKNPALTSCVLEPTVKLLNEGDVVRQDGSEVEYQVDRSVSPNPQ